MDAGIPLATHLFLLVLPVVIAAAAVIHHIVLGRHDR